MKRILTILPALLAGGMLCAQTAHNNELYNNGAIIHMEPGATVQVRGDVHMVSGTWTNNGSMQVEGNMYSNSFFQQRGTGDCILYNEHVNAGTPQFISGSYGVRGGQAQIGVNDGSFYNLRLGNDAGIVYLLGFGNVAEVRNLVEFDYTAIPNRIITHDYSAIPANGSGYNAVFGIMNPAAGLGSLDGNTVSLNGNLTGVDTRYIQGRLRRAVAPAGGQYGYVIGLEPAGAAAKRGVQYVRLDLNANNYDVIEGYFESASDNTVAGTVSECGGYNINYFGGTDHGEWVFNDYSGVGAGTYTVWVWPQDHTLVPQAVWLITKDDAIAGTANDCGPTYVGLSRSAFDGFSEFGVAGANDLLPATIVDINAKPVENRFIQVEWVTAAEEAVDHFEVERTEDFQNIVPIGQSPAAGMGGLSRYLWDDHDVIPNVEYHYRVRIVDADGGFSYTQWVSASLSEGMLPFEIRMWPNPANGTEAFVEITGAYEGPVTLKLVDMPGHQLWETDVEKTMDRQLVRLPLEQIAAGMYLLQVQAGEDQRSFRLLRSGIR